MNVDNMREALEAARQLVVKISGISPEAVHTLRVIDEALAHSRKERNAISPESFTEWLVREMPSGTVIGWPEWWAPRIYQAVIASPVPKPVMLVLQKRRERPGRSVWEDGYDAGWNACCKEAIAVHKANQVVP